ncbi:MAG: dCTP deaminase [Myxococcales bacterium]|nr:MAG: dCTP deaminase [Myxococcales bacterium]
MILTRDRILAEIAAGNVTVDPYDESAVGPASIDLHLGDEVRVLDKTGGPVPIRDDTDYRDGSHTSCLTTPYPLAPGETVLGITRERIKLPPDICGWLEGRSRFARLGLAIHVTAGFISPGVDNRQVLEISNLSGRVLELHVGTRICQIILQRTEGTAVYRGRFAAQDKP